MSRWPALSHQHACRRSDLVSDLGSCSLDRKFEALNKLVLPLEHPPVEYCYPVAPDSGRAGFDTTGLSTAPLSQAFFSEVFCSVLGRIQRLHAT